MTYCITRTNLGKLIFSVRTVPTIFLFFWVSVLVAQSPCPTDSVPKVTPSVTAPFCLDSASGSLILTVKPDSFTYKFKWTSGNGFNNTSQNLNNIKSGNYQVTVTNTRNLCDTTLEIVVSIGRDNQLPRVKCKNATLFLDATGTAVLTTNAIDNGTTDNCAPPQLFLSKTDFNCADKGVQYVWLIAVDAAQNRDSCEAVVTIKDTTAPQLICKNTSVYLDNFGKITLKPLDVTASVNDNCNAVLTLSQSDFTCNTIGSNIVQLVATDPSGNISTCQASVTILDTIKPDISCKNTTIYLNNSGNAVLNIESIKLSVRDNCALDTLILSKTNFSCLNIGNNEISLTARDKSANSAVCKAIVLVKDTIPPSVICPSNIVKTLGSGECSAAVAFSTTVTDNCSATVTQIAGLPSGSNFSIGDNTIIFKATDIAGNTATCSFNIAIKEFPATGSISCPNQINVSLNNSCEQLIEANYLLLGQNYGCFNRYSLDLYDQSIRLPDNYVRSAQIGRPISFKITDSKTLNSCRGDIVITDNLAPVIKKPIDIALSCYEVQPIENPLPKVSGTPEIISDCSNLPATIIYSDESFQTLCATPFTAAPTGFPSDISFNKTLARNCSRIIVRTFTVTDYYGNAAKCKQAIYINNAEMLYINCPESKYIQCTGEPLNLLPDSALINGKWVAGTGRPRLPNGIPISPNNNGSTNTACRFYATYTDIKINAPNGVYYFERTWTIYEDCSGRSIQCVQPILVDDNPPTLTCRTGFKTNLKTDKTVQVNAIDLILSTSDRCTPLARMKTGIRRIGEGTGFPDSTFLTYSCANIGTQTVEIWIKDEMGNITSCTTSFEIGDIGNYCAPPPLSISGKIVRENGSDLTADVLLNNLKNTESQTANPVFNFNNLIQTQTYRLEAQRPKDWVNGVTTFDIVLMSKHILDIDALDSPYKRIAADVNRDGEITSADMLLVRKLILRQIDSIPANRPWCFIPKNHVFTDPENPTLIPFEENYTFNPLKDSIKNADFIGIKIADLNLNARTTAINSPVLQARGAPYIFNTDNIFLNKNEKQTVVLTPSVETAQKDIAAFQCTFNFDKNIDIEKIEAVGLSDFSAANYHIFKNKIAISWNGKINAPPQLKLTLTANAPVFLNKTLSITSDLALAEAYITTGEAMPIHLEFNTISTHIAEKSVEKGFQLYQNVPNPFGVETVISFHLPQASSAILTIYDLNGKSLKTINSYYEAGKNHIKLSRNDLSTEGVYFYSLKTPFGVFTRKLLFL